MVKYQAVRINLNNKKMSLIFKNEIFFTSRTQDAEYCKRRGKNIGYSMKFLFVFGKKILFVDKNEERLDKWS